MTPEWEDIKHAPKDGTPVLAWVDPEHDPYVMPGTNGRYLTTYGSHAEGLGYARKGYHLVCCGGRYDDPDEHIPDWWFVKDSDWELPASPVCYLPLNLGQNPITGEALGPVAD